MAPDFQGVSLFSAGWFVYSILVAEQHSIYVPSRPGAKGKSQCASTSTPSDRQLVPVPGPCFLHRGHAYHETCTVSLLLLFPRASPAQPYPYPSTPAESQAAHPLEQSTSGASNHDRHSTLHPRPQPHSHRPRASCLSTLAGDHTSRPSHTLLNTRICLRLPRNSPTIVIVGTTHAARSALGDQQHPLQTTTQLTHHFARHACDRLPGRPTTHHIHHHEPQR